VSSSAQTVPLSVALVAGALVALNPCSVPLLPAFLSYTSASSAKGCRAHAPASCKACLLGRC
jgi:cytochrome c biogenesis protein CcdA